MVAEGDTLTVSVNGTQVNRMTDVVPAAGMIALQAEGTPIDFREHHAHAAAAGEGLARADASGEVTGDWRLFFMSSRRSLVTKMALELEI